MSDKMDKSEVMEIKRQEALESMPAPLQRPAKALAKLTADETKVTLGSVWTCGAIVADVLADEAKYGTNAISKLSAYLGVTTNELYSAKSVCGHWKEEEIKEMAQRRTAKGRHMTRTHLFTVARLANVRDRKKAIEMVFSDDVTVKDLCANFADLAKTNARSGGRSLTKPKTLAAGWKQLRELCKTTEKKLVKILQPYVLDATREPLSKGEPLPGKLASQIEETVGAINALLISVQAAASSGNELLDLANQDPDKVREAAAKTAAKAGKAAKADAASSAAAV